MSEEHDLLTTYQYQTNFCRQIPEARRNNCLKKMDSPKDSIVKQIRNQAKYK